MFKNLYFTIRILLFISATYLSIAKSVSQSVAYKPAVFMDSDRERKIKSFFPLIEKLYKEHSQKNNFPSMVFGIVVDGKLLYSSGTGYIDVKKKLAAHSRSAYRIASMTKSFTAAAILKLRDEGKLRLDDPASMYIPELKKVEYLTKDAPVVTVRNLLSHSSGFPEDNPWGDRQLADSDKDLLDLIKNGISFSNVPGVSYEYSNLAFAMLGNIITKVSGKPYQQYISENIFKPLGMNHTYWEYAKVPAQQLVHGYSWINESYKEVPLLHDGSYGAMGGLITTIEDFTKYLSLHLEAWPARSEDDNNILKRSSLREMHQPWTFNNLNASFKYPTGRSCPAAYAYGYGLRWVKDCEGRTFIGHSGGLPGFGSNWTIMPEYGIGVMCFSNLTYASTTGINMQVLDTLIRLAGLKPRQLPASPILEQRKAALLKLLPGWNSPSTKNLFAENFFLDYSLDSLRKNAQLLFDKAVKIQTVSAVFPENNLRGYFLLNGEQATLKASFTLTPENPPLIQAFELKEVRRE